MKKIPGNQPERNKELNRSIKERVVEYVKKSQLFLEVLDEVLFLVDETFDHEKAMKVIMTTVESMVDAVLKDENIAKLLIPTARQKFTNIFEDKCSKYLNEVMNQPPYDHVYDDFYLALPVSEDDEILAIPQLLLTVFMIGACIKNGGIPERLEINLGFRPLIEDISDHVDQRIDKQKLRSTEILKYRDVQEAFMNLWSFFVRSDNQSVPSQETIVEHMKPVIDLYIEQLESIGSWQKPPTIQKSSELRDYLKRITLLFFQRLKNIDNPLTLISSFLIGQLNKMLPDNAKIVSANTIEKSEDARYQFAIFFASIGLAIDKLKSDITPDIDSMHQGGGAGTLN